MPADAPRAAHDWLDHDAGPVVRPYAMTQGRVAPEDEFDLVAFVVATAAEGSDLVWKVELPAPATVNTGLYLQLAAPASGAELSTADVPASFLQEIGVEAGPERPLSGTGGGLFLDIPEGERSIEVRVPTVADAVAEPAEGIRWTVDSGEAVVPDLVGSVTNR